MEKFPVFKKGKQKSRPLPSSPGVKERGRSNFPMGPNFPRPNDYPKEDFPRPGKQVRAGVISRREIAFSPHLMFKQRYG